MFETFFYLYKQTRYYLYSDIKKDLHLDFEKIQTHSDFKPKKRNCLSLLFFFLTNNYYSYSKKK